MNGVDIEKKILTEHSDERQQCEVWSRVMGYFRPTSSYNKGKIGEFNERKFFKEPKSETLQH